MDKEKKYKNIATFSYGIARVPGLKPALGAQRLVVRPDDEQARAIDAIVGWGLKPNTKHARQYAARHRLPYLHLEDGFLRSVNLGVDGERPLSIIIDERGIYYDSTRASDLEAILAGDDHLSNSLNNRALLSRAQRARSKIVANRLSKYNNSPCDLDFKRDTRFKKNVLVIDQTAGDMSVVAGGLHSGGFQAMLEAALEEHPDAQVVVKTHPDVLAGKKKSCLGRIPDHNRIRVLTDPINPIRLLEKVDHVYVATSQLGFEALLVERPVTCFGVPFYAGWGLTDDRVAVPRRNRERSLDELFAAAYLLYPRYLDPDTGERCEAERIIEHLSLQRSMFEKNKGRIFCFGFSVWKRGFIKKYLKSPGNQIHFVRSIGAARRRGLDSSSKFIVWGSRENEKLRARAQKMGIDYLRMEDGFLRSVELGSDITVPASLVVDSRGIYYDPSAPSDLEHILAENAFAPEDIERATKLHKTIIRTKVSKYNLGHADKLSLPKRPSQKVILVPGQVEDDVSIKKGTSGVSTNAELLRQTRNAHPEDFVVFKPHPDVVSGNRKGWVPEVEAKRLCDAIIEDASISSCLDAADAVHTMTSLVGFEALLRDIPVTTYGQPFYAGWNLTNDRHPHPRRQRTLSLEELIAGTLIQYPRYLNTQTGEFTTPEYIVDSLARASASHSGPRAYKTNRVVRQLKQLAHFLRGLKDA